MGMRDEDRRSCDGKVVHEMDNKVMKQTSISSDVLPAYSWNAVTSNNGRGGWLMKSKSTFLFKIIFMRTLEQLFSGWHSRREETRAG